MWDTLLPQKKALIAAFQCHEQGASSIVFAPQTSAVDLCWQEGRRLYTGRAAAHHPPSLHRSRVSSQVFGHRPSGRVFCYWCCRRRYQSLGPDDTSVTLLVPRRARRESSFFKHIGQGVTQLHVDGAARLFSCGADGSMKVRQLPERELTVHLALY
ncbi:dmX-like protein 1 [Homalodisca vitripennis]|uniref:dmX-like protein 1 n=1 Tax=Homalodisca vitripennis TaxID=197043 RepID=UPI001EEA7E57|nr:dmX-like protein 1 [Homalodisca vitripennis]